MAARPSLRWHQDGGQLVAFNGSAETTPPPPLLYGILPHCTYQPAVRDKRRVAPWIISVAAPHDAAAAESTGLEADPRLSAPG